MPVDPPTREMVFLVALLVVFVDALFLGLLLGSIPRFFGYASWYRGLQPAEKRIFHLLGGGTYCGWALVGTLNVFISNRRFVVRILWSRLALVDLALSDIQYVCPSTWWWARTVKVVWRAKGSERSIDISVTRRNQAEMLEAFQGVGVRVIEF